MIETKGDDTLLLHMLLPSIHTYDMMVQIFNLMMAGAVAAAKNSWYLSLHEKEQVHNFTVNG
jgi:hypothetical protein